MEFQDNDTLGFNNFIVKSSPSTNKLFKKFLGDYSWLHGELEG